ncbi:unnamed protein product [Parajaminaea phylloscopi]
MVCIRRRSGSSRWDGNACDGRIGPHRMNLSVRVERIHPRAARLPSSRDDQNQLYVGLARIAYLPITRSNAMSATPGRSSQQRQQQPAQSGPSRPGRPAGEGGGQRGRRAIQYRGLFQRDLPMMMYGFGDSRNPDPQSVEVMELLTIGFLTDLCHRCRPAPYYFPASKSYAYSSRSKVKVDDLRFALRKDEKKLARLEELLYLEGVISGAKKILDAGAIDDVARQVEAEERQQAQDKDGRGAAGGLALPGDGGSAGDDRRPGENSDQPQVREEPDEGATSGRGKQKRG